MDGVAWRRRRLDLCKFVRMFHLSSKWLHYKRWTKPCFVNFIFFLYLPLFPFLLGFPFHIWSQFRIPCVYSPRDNGVADNLASITPRQVSLWPDYKCTIINDGKVSFNALQYELSQQDTAFILMQTGSTKAQTFNFVNDYTCPIKSHRYKSLKSAHTHTNTPATLWPIKAFITYIYNNTLIVFITEYNPWLCLQTRVGVVDFNSTITLHLPWPYKSKTIYLGKMWIAFDAIMVFNKCLKVNGLHFQVALFTVSLWANRNLQTRWHLCRSSTWDGGMVSDRS